MRALLKESLDRIDLVDREVDAGIGAAFVGAQENQVRLFS